MVFYDWANDGSVGEFLDMLWFQVYRGVSATLGNGCKIQGQNYVGRLQGRVL